jgi:hypothetical protein
VRVPDRPFADIAGDAKPPWRIADDGAVSAVKWILAGTVVLALAVASFPLWDSLDAENAAHCSGYGGVISWELHDRASDEHEIAVARRAALPEFADTLQHDIVTPCDQVALRSTLAALGDFIVICVLGGGIALFVRRRQRTKRSTDSALN